MKININKPQDDVRPSQLEAELKQTYAGKFSIYFDNDDNQYFVYTINDLDDDQLATFTSVINNHTPSLDVPEAIGPAQLRIALRRKFGISSQQLQSSVEAFIASLSDANAQADAEDLWTYATLIQRSHPLVDALGVALGLTPRQIDATFALAATI
jgi:hypothetical protein